jgi:hypothetical protein
VEHGRRPRRSARARTRARPGGGPSSTPRRRPGRHFLQALESACRRARTPAPERIAAAGGDQLPFGEAAQERRWARPAV